MLNGLYIQLTQSTPIVGGSLLGLPVDNKGAIWIASDSENFPALLVPARKDDLRPDIVLRSVDVLFSRNCEIETTSGSTPSDCYTIIRLKENSPDVVRLFLKILEDRFCLEYKARSNADVAKEIKEVATLFSRMDDNTRDLVGLWGELHLIKKSGNISGAVRCWSNNKSAKYDFVCGQFLLEVKTTLKVDPKHRFSLEQLRPSGDVPAYVASIRVVEVPSGQSVGDLMDEIALELADVALRGAFIMLCVAKGGADLYRSLLTLQVYPDDAAFLFVSTQDIPAPRVDEESPIENVRFDVNLSSVRSIDAEMRQSILRFDD